jgi:hypothetical protein
MGKSLNILGVVIYIYLMIGQLCMFYFWYLWAQTHGFWSSLILGPIVAEIKGLLFPFFI